MTEEISEYFLEDHNGSLSIEVRIKFQYAITNIVSDTTSCNQIDFKCVVQINKIKDSHFQIQEQYIQGAKKILFQLFFSSSTS